MTLMNMLIFCAMHFMVYFYIGNLMLRHMPIKYSQIMWYQPSES